MGRGKQGNSKAEGVCATDAAAAYKRGLKLCGQGNYGKALTCFDRAIAFRVDCSHYFAARAKCKQAMGKYVDAYHDYVSAIRLNRNKCTNFSCRALCLVKMGMLEAALEDFSKACELEPTVAVHHYQKASLLHHRLARPEHAVTSYAECLVNVGPEDSAMALRCLQAKGACLLEQGRAQEAVVDLSRAVEVSDPSPAALHHLAKALKAVGQEKRALAALEEALNKWEQAPPTPAPQVGGGSSSHTSGMHAAFFDRGVIRLDLGDDVGALLDFNKAVTLSKGSRGEYFVQRARARARVAMGSESREEAEAGVQDIEKAMELESNNPEFFFTAGILCSRMGEYERALYHLQHLLEFFEKQKVSASASQEEKGGRGARAMPKGGTRGSAATSVSPWVKNEMDSKNIASPTACEFEVALCLFKLGRPLEALRLADSALTNCCSLDVRRYQLRGLILHDLRSYREAIKDFTASICVNGQRPEGFLLRGRSLAGLASHERAIRDFTTALTIFHTKNARGLQATRLGGDGERCRAFSDSKNKGGKGEGTNDGKPLTSSSNNNTQEAMPESNGPTRDKCFDGNNPKRSNPAEAKQIETHGDGGSSKLRREDTCRKDSQIGDGGDGMGEAGFMVGACHYARALSLQQLGRHGDAATDFDAAIAEGPVNWQRLWHRATCLAELGEAFQDPAARDLQACISMAEDEEPPPQMRNFLFQVGLAYLRLKKFAIALKLFDRAWREEGRRVLQQDDTSGGPKGRSRLSFDGSTGAEFEEASLHYHRGLCLMKAGELDEAHDALSLAIESRKSPAQTIAKGPGSSCAAYGTDMMESANHLERGKVRQLLRDFEGARSDFTVCLAKSQERPQTTVNTSLHPWAGCVSGSPHDARTLFWRGWANKALGNLAEAAADFENARLLEPLHPHLSVDYRNIFDTELVDLDDVEPLTQLPALFHS